MIKKLCLFLLLSFLPLTTLAQQGQRTYTVTNTTPQGATGNIGSGIAWHQLNWNVIGTVSACMVELDSSADGITWTPGGVITAQSCTTTGQSAVVNIMVNYVRIHPTAFTGTAGSSVVVLWNGWNSDPVGAGGGTVTTDGTGATNQVAIFVAPTELGSSTHFASIPATGQTTITIPDSSTIPLTLIDAFAPSGTNLEFTLGDDGSSDIFGNGSAVTSGIEFNADGSVDVIGNSGADVHLDGADASVVISVPDQTSANLILTNASAPGGTSLQLGMNDDGSSFLNGTTPAGVEGITYEADGTMQFVWVGQAVPWTTGFDTGNDLDCVGSINCEIELLTSNPGPSSTALLFPGGLVLSNVVASPITFEFLADTAGLLELGTPDLTSDISGDLLATTYATNINCSSPSGACTSAPVGSVSIAAGATTVTVATTTLTANSRILLTFDASLGTNLGITCNVTEPALYGVSARVPGVSFTITATAPVVNPACFSYLFFN